MSIRKTDIMWLILVPLAIAMIVYVVIDRQNDMVFPGETNSRSVWIDWPNVGVFAFVIAIVATIVYLVRRRLGPG